mmetsp:Transcript_28603/g.69290  ORF Transcript_28603/g.69290 Transcript_28603/m.69290 type:complete len:217 (-) Transcript_28603:744-1394(-)
MGSRRGQTQHLFHEIINHQLTGNDHTDMQYACGQSSEELRTSPTLVNLTNGNAKGFSRRGRTFSSSRTTRLLFLWCLGGRVCFGQDHVSWLTQQASSQTGTGCSRNGDQPLVDNLQKLTIEFVEEACQDVKGNLLSKSVGNLLGEHGPHSTKKTQESILLDQFGQPSQQGIILIGLVRDLLNSQGFHGAQQQGCNGTCKDTGQQKKRQAPCWFWSF